MCNAPSCDFQLPHQEFWLEVRSLVADGVSFAHAKTTGGNGSYTKIKGSSPIDDGDTTSEASKPASAVQTNESEIASAGGEKSLGEVRDDTVHSSQQKIKVVMKSTTSPGKQEQTENADSDDADDELVE